MKGATAVLDLQVASYVMAASASMRRERQRCLLLRLRLSVQRIGVGKETGRAVGTSHDYIAVVHPCVVSWKRNLLQWIDRNDNGSEAKSVLEKVRLTNR
mmetsp:Transcript_23346/g.64778  ORF Transcript_23346/g.64778 Transcript_23346/m.64778 type:complete len:99 (-) Transcript_23346:36-332(-)